MQSVGKFRPVVALLRPANHPAVQISVRYGGGGGRPGARPAFNWKEKVELGIKGTKRKEFKARPSGVDLTEITNFLSEARGDTEIDLSDMKEYKEEPRPTIDKYKVVDVSRLYGSSKPCGKLEVEHTPYTGPFTKRKMSKGRML